MDKYYILAGIVSYNPDIVKLKDNLIAVCPQLDKVLIFDNGSENQNEILTLVDDFSNAQVITSSDNLGIATALNKLIEYGSMEKYDWIITLDQDSVCTKDYIDAMIPYLTIEPQIGIAAPVIIDRKVGIIGHNPYNKYARVNTCITSGSFVNIKVWEQVGKYDESMFIDSVDFEFCYRVRKNGFKVVQCKDVKLLHELGNSEHKFFLFLRITISGHSAFRKYYIARNNIYYPIKHHLPFHFIRGNCRNLWLLIVIILYEDDKKNKIIAVLKGWKNAYRRQIYEN